MSDVDPRPMLPESRIIVFTHTEIPFATGAPWPGNEAKPTLDELATKAAAVVAALGGAHPVEFHLRAFPGAHEPEVVRLSTLRLQHVRNALIKRGVPPALLVPEEPDPAASRDGAARVTFEIFLPEQALDVTIRFPTGSAQVPQSEGASLQRLASAISRSPYLSRHRIMVSGQANTFEGADPALLSTKRANAVREVLVHLGVSPEELYCIGKHGAGLAEVVFAIAPSYLPPQF